MYPAWPREEENGSASATSLTNYPLRRPPTSQVSPKKHMTSSSPPPRTAHHTPLRLLYETSTNFLRGPPRETHASLKYFKRSSIRRPSTRLGVSQPSHSLAQDCSCSCGSIRQGRARAETMSHTVDRLGSQPRPCAVSPSSSSLRSRHEEESRLAPFRRRAPSGGPQCPRLGPPPPPPLPPPRGLSAAAVSAVSSGRSLLMSLALCLLLAGGTVQGSEFPDRECCDSVPPPPPHYHQATSTTTTTTPTPHIGQNTSTVSVSHGVSGVINCITARQQCHNDPSCRDVLTMLHKICGPELVACATVTPGKCKLLLKTLDNFDYLKSCSCAEPHIDFNCYTFRETIFSHPCSLVDTPDDDKTIMPTCNEAHEMCKNKGSCLKNYMEFVNLCSFNGITCTAQESEKCNESWRKMRLSPLFGCVCSPPPQMHALAYGSSQVRLVNDKENCIWLYNKTHENPCLAGQKDISKATQVETSQTMCHVALDECQKDEQCSPLLQGVMVWCEHTHCEPDRCRTALQEFYQKVSVVRRLQVAFCVCRQSDPDGECLTAMRKLHPTCAERHAGRDPMKCHNIAEECRQNRGCRKKLQEYEQKCAADAMTGRCSDTHRNCQQAVMNILGTELHATCVCKGTDFLHQHDCYTWQKLLWSNPCVIESHLQLHEEINSGASEELDEMFRQMTPAHTTPPPRQPYAQPSPDTDYRRPTNYGEIRYSPQDPRPSETYTHDRSGWRLPGLPMERGHGVGLGRPFGSRNGETALPPGKGGRTRVLNGGGRRYPPDGDDTRWGGHKIDSTRLNGGRTRNGDGISLPGGGRSRGGLGVSRDRGRSGITIGGTDRGRTGITLGGSDRGRTGITLGGSDRGRTGITLGGSDRGSHRGGTDRQDGGQVLWNGRTRGGLGVGADRNGGDVFGTNQNGIYRSRGRGELGGHRGTPITLGEPDRDGAGLIPGGRGTWRVNHVGRPGGTRGYPRPDGPDRDIPTHPPIYKPEGYPVTPHVYVAVTTTPTPRPTAPPSTTTLATTTSPRRSCSMKTGDMNTLNIPEGSSKRHYKDSDCSELCHCIPHSREKELQASCITLACMENKSCNTTRAVYPHTAPYYLAYRGVCVCYGGNFICQKPNPEEYNLGPGIYLFLGYSRGEVEILMPYTETNEHEAVKVLETVLIRDYGFKCTLETKHHLGENFIILAKLVVNPDTYISPFLKQRREKEECAGPLQDLAQKINARPRHDDIITDAILSMFILAAVDVNIPEPQTSLPAAAAAARLDLLTFLAVLSAHLLIRWASVAPARTT